MKRFRDLAIQRKMILIIMATAMVALLLVCSGFVVYDVLAFRRSILGNLSILASVIASNSTAALAFGDSAAAGETLAALQAETHIVEAAMYNSQGQVFATYSRAAGGTFSPPPPQNGGHHFGDDHLSLHRGIELAGERLGTLYIRSDLEAMRTRLTRYAQIVALVVATSLAVTLLLSAQLQRLISAPILRLVHTVRRVSAESDYSLRTASTGGDEIGTLIDSFNEMLGQIQTRERALQERTRQLEAANKELESFSYSVSHDLRVPLRALDGFSLILLEEHGGEVGAEGKRLLQVIRSSAQEMGQLIDDLLSFSRFGRLQMERSEVDMNGLARKLVAELLALEGPRRPRVEIADLPATQGDRRMLRQVFVNLVANALKFTRHQADPRVTVGGYAAASERVYFVRDNGVGFDMRYADKLFNVFQRLHSTEEFEGTGVGLAIVQRIVHRHGGRVWAEGEVGRGATFYFALPGRVLEASPGAGYS